MKEAWTWIMGATGSTARARALGLFAIAITLATMGVSAARATVMVEVPMERLVSESDVILFGRVARVDARLVIDDRGAAPHTRSTIEIIDVLKGRAEDRVQVDEIGGIIQGRGTWIAGTPRFRLGEECVVFLRALPGGTYRTYAMAQGHFEVRPGVPGVAARVVRDTSAMGLASWTREAMQVREGTVSSMPLDAFLGYVRQLVESQEAAR